jgi:histidyl-tRNA synthetase
MAQKPSIPKGTRDFSPEEVVRRNYIMNTVRSCFRTYGYQPIETPSFEKNETLLGKYGEEGDRLIFKILNSGDYLNKVDDALYAEKDSKKLTPMITEKALRYDLTVPFARYVVQYQNDITFPFKRYQIQPVWRADRPQKGRFREFYQCDADAIGTKSLWQEIEFVQLYDDVFNKLNLRGVTIKLNNRKILSGIAEVIGAEDKLIDFTIALDKLEKIGKDGVVDEMISKGISEKAIDKLDDLFTVAGTATQKLEQLKQMLSTSEIGLKGISELEFIVKAFTVLPLNATNLEIDITLARGLNYYTGAIYEVVPPIGVNLGSIGGGGRYDDLTGIFGLSDMSGIGISFGLDRIYLVLEELDLFPSSISENTRVLFINFGEKESLYALRTIAKLRALGVACELYPEATKIGKQMSYADRRKIKYVVMVGEEEMNTKTFTLKKMKTGKQQTVTFFDLKERLKKKKTI